MTPEDERQERLMASLAAAGARPMLSPSTPFRFSMAQMCIICGALIMGTWTVLEYVDRVRKSVDDTNASIAKVELTLKDMSERLRRQEISAEDFSRWRWIVAHDLNQIGRKTSVEIWTKEDK